MICFVLLARFTCIPEKQKSMRSPRNLFPTDLVRSQGVPEFHSIRSCFLFLFLCFSLLTWQHPVATRKLFTNLCVALLASLLLKGPTLFLLIGNVCEL